MLAEALSGNTGRLLPQPGAGQKRRDAARSPATTARKYEGLFEIGAEAKEGHTPEELETAIDAELDKLKGAADAR